MSEDLHLSNFTKKDALSSGIHQNMSAYELDNNLFVNNKKFKIDCLTSTIRDAMERILFIFKLIDSDLLIQFIESSEYITSKEYEKLKRIADIIIKKATCDQNFAIPCVSICSALQNVHTQFHSNNNKKHIKITFKELLVHKCLIVIKSTAWDEDARTEHNYLVAKTRFVCELFKQEILTSEIIILCMQNLIKKYCAIHVEFICNILAVLGRDLDQSFFKMCNITSIFDKLEKFVSNSNKLNISSRMYSMMINIIQFRRNNWIWKDIEEPISCRNVTVNSKSTNKACKKHNKSIKLHQAKNPWIPSRIKTTLKKNNQFKYKLDTVAEDTEFMKSIQSIVNKVTIDNVVELIKVVKSLPLNSYYKLNKTVDVIMNQVLKDHRFALPFATLCSALQHIQVSNDTEVSDLEKSNLFYKSISKEVSNITVFKDLIISKCLSIYNMNYEEIITNTSTNIYNCTDVLLVKKEDDFGNKKNYEQLRVMSNCRFVLELYKQNVVDLRILYLCLENFMKKNNENIECACLILLAAGKELIQNYDTRNIFEKLEHLILSKKNKFPYRIRFLVEDVLNMRNAQLSKSIKTIYNNKQNIKKINSVDTCPVVTRPKNIYASDMYTETFEIVKRNKRSIQIKLQNESKNVWIPPRVKEKKFGSQNTIIGKKLKKKMRDVSIENTVQSIFNKVTIVNVEKLSKVIKQLNIQSLCQFNKLINIIVNQALCNQEFSSVYAQVLVGMKNKKVACGFNRSDNKITNWIHFQELMVRKCLDIFDMADIEINELENSKYVKHNSLLVKERLKIRERVLANCKFILELFKQNIITPYTIIYCYEILMLKPHEEFLECACNIILYAGQDLIQDYDVVTKFNQLKKFISTRETLVSKGIHCTLNIISEEINHWMLEKSTTQKINMLTLQLLK